MCRLKNSIHFSLLCMLSGISNFSYATFFSDHPGFKISVYGGTSNTSVNAGTIQGFAETDSLNPHSHKQYNPTWGLGAAYGFLLAENSQNIIHNVSVGLDWIYFKDTQNGYVWLYQQHVYNNYYYHLPVTSMRLMADAELTFHSIWKYLFPLIEAGVGVARNTTRYYDESLLSNTEGLTTASHSQNQFAYTLGAGIKISLPLNSELSLRYLYANLGHAETANRANVPLTAPIDTKLSSQTWLIGLTHFFN